MHLNRDYVYPGGDYDRSQLFSIQEITPDIAVPDEEICCRVEEQFRILSQPEPPSVDAGAQCSDPMQCEFFNHCNQDVPDDHVSFLPGISKKKLEELSHLGITSIAQIPDEFQLSDRQRNAREALISGREWIGGELANELRELNYPLCFMDFETIFPALPLYPGLRPYDHVPFQWSVHRVESPGEEARHFEFLAEDGSDPRIPFVESLIAALQNAGTVMVYNESFEKTRLQELAGFLPQYADPLNEIRTRVWDLLPCIRRNVYHRGFAGSFSLKSVLPALIPEMTYEGMVVADGGQAGLAYEKMVRPGVYVEERASLRAALLQYCGQDTFALVKLLQRLAPADTFGSA